MNDVVSCSVDSGIGILQVDSPPVNALGASVRCGLADGLRRLAADSSVNAIVLLCSGRTFFAGADINELGRPPIAPTLRAVFDCIETSRSPIVAAIHGTALGGGMELALVCHFRIAVPSAKLGLPEVRLGLLPGAGGTQRLPRLIGIPAALDLLITGRAVGAAEACELGMLDRLAREEHLREDALAFARTLHPGPRSLRRVRDREEEILAARRTPEVFAEFRRKNARGLQAPERIINAVEAAVHMSFEEGLARESELFQELLNGPQSAALRYAFFAERQTLRLPESSAGTAAVPVNSVGVVGAGTMGTGIAMCFADASIPVAMMDRDQAMLDRGMEIIRSNYQSLVSKGRMSLRESEERVSLISPTLELHSLRDADLIIEAVYESMEIKKRVFSELDRIQKRGGLLASNTSFLDLDAIAAITQRPDAVLGLHFFSPAYRMRLLEVVRCRETSLTVVETALKLAKRIGKIPVVSRVCAGFIANRLMRPRGVQAERLVVEGADPAHIDRVMCDFGFAMGPFQTIDLVGLDVLGHETCERTLRGDFVARGRLGQKNGGGFYDYDERRHPTFSLLAAQIIANFANHTGVARQPPPDDEEILSRLLYPVVNEGAKILEEGIALRSSDIDVAAMQGYKWPAHTGGPMFWADAVGLPAIFEHLKRLESQYGPEYRPARLLTQLVSTGGSFARH